MMLTRKRSRSLQRVPTANRLLVLLSGGIDSAATMGFFLAKNADVAALFFDYQQPSRRSEWRAASAMASHFGVPIQRARLGFRPAVHNGEYRGRNALFVLNAAAALADVGPLVIAAGLHRAAPYYDTTPTFVADIQRVLDGYFGGRVTLSAPFVGMTKTDVVGLAKRYRVPLSLTYSCLRQDAPACGKCGACLDRFELGVD